MSTIHPSAVIAPGARIAEGCDIGPFCVIGADVVLGVGCTLKSHVVLAGDTHIGPGSTIFPFAVIGEVPQDKKYDGEATQLRIGARNTIREHVTMNPGTAGGGGLTRIGDDGLFLAGCHIAHDCQVGDRVIVVNNSAVAGHCQIGNDVVIGGLSGIHQFVRIGDGAMIGALSMVTRDVVPHGLVQGPRAHLDGLNYTGLRRRGAARDDIAALRAAFASLRDDSGAFTERARALRDASDNAYVRDMLDFILAESDRSVLTPQ